MKEFLFLFPCCFSFSNQLEVEKMVIQMKTKLLASDFFPTVDKCPISCFEQELYDCSGFNMELQPTLDFGSVCTTSCDNKTNIRGITLKSASVRLPMPSGYVPNALLNDVCIAKGS